MKMPGNDRRYTSDDRESKRSTLMMRKRLNPAHKVPRYPTGHEDTSPELTVKASPHSFRQPETTDKLLSQEEHLQTGEPNILSTEAKILKVTLL